MQRACAAALVAAKKSVVYNPGHSNDDKAAMSIIEALGATIEKGNEEIVIDSYGFAGVLSPFYGEGAGKRGRYQLW